MDDYTRLIIRSYPKSKIKSKIAAYEFFIYQAITKYAEMENVSLEEALIKGKFNKLKCMKLLFLMCMAGRESPDTNMLYIFDNWYAMPYGHAERDILENYDLSEVFDFKNTQIKFKQRSKGNECR